MQTDFDSAVTVSPTIWPEKKLALQPGDLSFVAPAGNGVYGYQNPPIAGLLELAPQQDPCGGVVYFGSRPKQEDLLAIFRLWKRRENDKDYAVFLCDSDTPDKDGYLRQVRFVSRFALRFMFNAISESEYESFPEQELNLSEAVWKFIQVEQSRWGTMFGDPRIAGLFGGDGDYAQEELSFGLMLENDYHGIFRIWSRAWLVTK